MCLPLVLLVVVVGPALALAGVLVELGGHGPAGVAAAAGLVWLLVRAARAGWRWTRAWYARIGGPGRP